jgi:hypothetical protein
MKTEITGPRPQITFRTAAFALVVVLLALGAPLAQGQTSSLDRWTVDSGGGTSTGGAFAVNGTIGQPEAGPVLTGGNYAVQGGFWPGVVRVSPEVPPTLYIQFSDEGITISWAPATSGFLLEEAADLSSAQWVLAPTGNPVSLPVVESSRFYRLRKQ